MVVDRRRGSTQIGSTAGDNVRRSLPGGSLAWPVVRFTIFAGFFPRLDLVLCEVDLFLLSAFIGRPFESDA